MLAVPGVSRCFLPVAGEDCVSHKSPCHLTDVIWLIPYWLTSVHLMPKCLRDQNVKDDHLLLHATVAHTCLLLLVLCGTELWKLQWRSGHPWSHWLQREWTKHSFGLNGFADCMKWLFQLLELNLHFLVYSLKSIKTTLKSSGLFLYYNWNE